MCKQQIPNPDAQFPMDVPPESVHSSAVLQTPFNDDEDVVVHSSLGNETTENNEKAPEMNKNINITYCHGIYIDLKHTLLIWFWCTITW